MHAKIAKLKKKSTMDSAFLHYIHLQDNCIFHDVN